eukprot:CAMPEP_0115033840 /NCGR_PEP_ID=MMETSP0216-20121206/40213_1 /TAXON_ID=223996 /ORGANISM="Protocruzia adherens, Strain Boccale" /LENGTH=961 /DNA_ID=CAMNT_0002412447 /DNA_START=107 /DNA_END=2992 /DNA_ORIENTATION=+
MEEKEEKELVKTLTAKEMKALAKPEFAANPEKFYPTETFAKMGFSRAQCPKCENHFWRATEERITCGDSNCEEKYSFIGVGCGKGAKGQKITYAEAWNGFKKSLGSTRVPCTAIDRYPVVARWRNDVDYVAAGIFCFQPYCVTGELDSPANPLIQPQFCLRFNDLDNIGLTGRHYSGFIMLGIQVFNKPGAYKFFKDECVEFNYRWLTEELEIPKEEITFIEDVWAGGGNLGPSIEYFVRGLEVGNMVFMQYKTFHDGSREELPVKVIDTGIGLERIPWLINGSATSYMDTFAEAFEFFSEKIGVTVDQEIWEKFGPYSCQLNVDEVENLDQTWQQISDKIDVPVEKIKEAIAPIKEMYIILDHTRTLMMVIEDGSLPSNVGGGSNVRNILRRVFYILHKTGWWDKLGMDGLIDLFQKHKADLCKIYGEFREYKSFREIIEIEYERWQSTDEQQKIKLEKLLKKKKVMDIDDWILAVTTWGMSPDKIAEISGQTVPLDFYYQLDLRNSQLAAAAETVLYDTTHLEATKNLYYDNHHLYDFEAKILDIFPNLKNKNALDLVILDQSAFYPTSGGQQHDIGTMTIKGEKYDVVNVEKVGHSIMHVLDRPLEGEIDSYKGETVQAHVDFDRRNQLRNHHTGTHIIFAACRKVLGPHIWQNGAKKTVEQAHLDITHYRSLTREEELGIENEANRIIMACKDVKKSLVDKAVAEKEHGFRLYQGGIVPGNELRVVNIEDTDVEACCGTHCDNTAEVGWIRILKTSRISDGIVRLYYVASEKAIDKLNQETGILHSLCQSWGVNQPDILPTASRFFDGYKKFGSKVKKQDQQILDLQMKLFKATADQKLAFVQSDQENPTLYFSFMSHHAADLQAGNKGIVYVGDNFVFGLLGSPELYDAKQLIPAIKAAAEMEKDPVLKINNAVKKPKAVKNIAMFSATIPKAPKTFREKVCKFLAENGFADSFKE